MMKGLLGLILAFLLLFGSPAVLFAQEQEQDTVFIIPISGEIDQALTVFLRRGIEKASSEEAKLIIFEIDTFGGRVDSALQIATLIGSLDNMKTVAYVALEPEGTAVSWSAGALIAMSANRIYMAPGTSMGAAAPILQSPDGTAQSADEKTVSAVRTQMAALAEKNGYPAVIAEAMVDKDIELIEVTVDGELQVLTRSQLDALLRNAQEPDSIIEGPVLSEPGKLLSLTAEQMERYRLSSGTVSTTAELLTSEGVDQPRILELSATSADRAVRLFTSAGVTSLLIFIGVIALFMELASPGFGIPGGIALAAFGALFTGNILLGMVGSLELLLFVTGVALLIIEIFIIPGFGVAGISGLVLMAMGLVFSMQDFVIPTLPWQWDLLGKNVLLVLGNLVAGFVAFGILAFLIPKYTPFKRLTLSLNQETDQGYTSQEAVESQHYLGKSGTAVTTLRPSGKAEIADQILQVMTEGDFIEQGSPVVVSRVDGNRIVVKKDRRGGE
jgi:membrane-bound serine protease (ClpP class)